MPNFKLTFNSQHNYVHVQFFGVLTDSDFRECLEEVNRLYPGFNTITDLSEASLIDFTLKDIEVLVRVLIGSEEQHDTMFALVAPGDLEFGFCRMFDALADPDLPQDRAVFRSLEAAKDWLQQ